MASVLCNTEHRDLDHVLAKEAGVINPSVYVVTMANFDNAFLAS
jgi:hypothetical protein|tara:strand:- start:234 stop:365 length:132 start_codon:yes stop_codon:yes gene_type:complete